MILISSPVYHLAALVAGSAAPGARPVIAAIEAPAADSVPAPVVPPVAADAPAAVAVEPPAVPAALPVRAELAMITAQDAPATETGTPAPPTDPAAMAPPPADAAMAPEAPPEVLDSAPMVDANGALIEGRRRPGDIRELPPLVTQENLGAVRAPPPEAFPTDQIPVPDRWRLVQALCPDKNFPGASATCHSILDPYHQNFLKGDRPIDVKKLPKWLPFKLRGDDWFLALSGISDTIIEPRFFPTPINRQLNSRPNNNDVFGNGRSEVAAQTFIFGGSLIKGSTAFMPPIIEYRFIGAYQFNYVDVKERRVLSVLPSNRSRRFDRFFGIQEAFIDYHLRNVSDRFDFDSVRIGIQPFQADFRGFLFNDNQLGIRFFGNRDNNRFQYNAAVFWRLEKDSNTGLNDVTQRIRDDIVVFANVYRQDFPIPGLTGQITVAYNMNREKGEIERDTNGFPVRPVLLGNLGTRNYDAVYFGYNTDGRIGRLNLTASLYGVVGRDSNNFFTGRKAKIRAGFAAAEASYDVDWMRFRLSAAYATGDGKPYDNKETGYDAIFENPIFAGADTSYFIRQTIPFAGGGRVVSISSRNGLLNDLRSSKEQGQSNFNNPGTMILGVGGDFDITPKFRVSLNASHVWFENTATMQALRTEATIPKSFGTDYSVATIWRPKAIQNVVFRISGAVFDPSKGFLDLLDSTKGNDRYYSVLFNAILSF